MQGSRLIDRALVASLIETARNSPRLRTNHNFHTGPDERVNRFLNVMMKGTYIAPHRHRRPPKPEALIALEGEVQVFIFDDEGHVTESHAIGRDAFGIDIPAGIWHTVAVLSTHAVCYEVKPGPYSAADDKEFAPWGPREGDPGTADYLESLIRNIRGQQ